MDKLISHNKNGDNIKVKVRDIFLGGEKKVIISGPCSVENYDIMRKIVKELKSSGVDMLRGGAFKPRTSPYDFQGLSFEGIDILHELSCEFNMPVVTEVLDTRDLEKVVPKVHMVQIGSRNMYNYSLLKELGKLKVPVLLKRGMSATVKEWLYAAEYILCEGNSNVVLCERGIRTFETSTRNTLDLNSVALIKQQYRLPIIVDPSHGTGLRSLIYPMSLASIASGADGLIIESHINPNDALSDGKQTIEIDTLKKIVNDIKKISNFK